MGIRSTCYKISKVIPIVGIMAVGWMVYSNFQPVPVTPLTDRQAWPTVISVESCDVYPTVGYDGPVCEDCKDGVPVSENGLYSPNNDNLYKYLPRIGSGIDYIGPSCDLITEVRGNTVPESGALLNVILGGLVMILIRGGIRYENLLRAIHAAAERGEFDHTFKGVQRVCADYRRRLAYEGFHITLRNAKVSLDESDEPMFYMLIDWSDHTT